MTTSFASLLGPTVTARVTVDAWREVLVELADRYALAGHAIDEASLWIEARRGRPSERRIAALGRARRAYVTRVERAERVGLLIDRSVRAALAAMVVLEREYDAACDAWHDAASQAAGAFGTCSADPP